MSQRYGEGKLQLDTLFGDYPRTRALREGRIASDIVELQVDQSITDAPKGFKPLVRECRFDVAEVAIATYLQAKAAGKPYALLPFVMNGNFHHGSLAVRVDAGIETPKDLEGKRVGLRSWTQTTPTWVRGFLMNDYGVDLAKVRWVTFEDAHIQDFFDPPFAERAETGKKLADMLLDGEIDGAMMGQNMPDDPRVRRLLPDPDGAAREWSAQHDGAIPINHMVCVRQELVDERPDAVREIFRMLLASRDASEPPMTDAMRTKQPIGLENFRAALELANTYACQQGLIPRTFSVDELFDDFTASLGRD